MFTLIALLMSGCLSLYNLAHNPDVKRISQLKGQPPKTWAQHRTLRMLTYNVHDLYIASDNRPERMRSIGAFIAKLEPDFVALQEAFIESDRDLLLRELMHTKLKHSKYYESGLVGSGLLVISAYPIEAANFRRFSRNGKCYKPWHGDWWAGKGVALARLRLSQDEYIDLFNLHVHARYDFTHPDDEYLLDRLSQIKEIKGFVRDLSVSSIPALILGDFNATFSSRELASLRGGVRLLSSTHQDLIDLILWRRVADYRVDTLSTEIKRPTLMVDGVSLPLSDHPAIISTVMIKPHR